MLNQVQIKKLTEFFKNEIFPVFDENKELLNDFTKKAEEYTNSFKNEEVKQK